MASATTPQIPLAAFGSVFAMLHGLCLNALGLLDNKRQREPERDRTRQRGTERDGEGQRETKSGHQGPTLMLPQVTACLSQD